MLHSEVYKRGRERERDWSVDRKRFCVGEWMSGQMDGWIDQQTEECVS